MPAGNTLSTNLFKPEIVKPMLSGAIDNKLKLTKLFKVDNSLSLQDGAVVKVAKYGTIADAVVVAEGAAIPVEQLTHTVVSMQARKIGNGVGITDEAVGRGQGDPVKEAILQIASSINRTIEKSAFECVYKGINIQRIKNDTTAVPISYNGIVDMVGLLNEEDTTEKVLIIHPAQYTQLLKDPNFVDKSKYGGNVLMDGEIGMIAGCRVVRNNNVVLGTAQNITTLTNLKTDCYGTILIALAPIELGVENHPLTLVLERDTYIETERDAQKQITNIYGSKTYGVYVSNDTKVVLGNFKK